MTEPAYSEEPEDGIDVSHLCGRNPPSDESRVLFTKYQTAFDLCLYWPDVEHYRQCVAAFDALRASMRGEANGSH